MARDTAGTMLQSFEAIKEAVGLDIPKMLKDVSTGGLVGKAANANETSAAPAEPVVNSETEAASDVSAEE